jgi:hypothetical protein
VASCLLALTAGILFCVGATSSPHEALPPVIASASVVLASQQPPPAARGVAPPDQNLPPHIRRLTHFGERADFSLDGTRVLLVSKTFGDAMEVELATGVIRNLTSHYPHHGYTRALYLSNGDILLSGPTEFDPANPGQARTNSWLFVLKPGTGERPHPLGVKCAEGPVPSRRRLHVAWSYRAAQFPGEMPPGSSQIHEADIVYTKGIPTLANQRLVLDSRALPFRATLEPQNFRPPQERELIFSAYDYQDTEVFGVELATGKLTNYSNAPGIYDEPEGIFPSGEFTTVESDLHEPDAQGFDRADVYKLSLDGSGKMERLTRFADVPTYRASNPVVSDDGRYMAFQMGRAGVAAGTGYGLFLYDFTRRPGGSPER